ncbi:unnamed protein product [Lathyrus sativus]|nr:unnamed protein product [Lathyrus sativus]
MLPKFWRELLFNKQNSNIAKTQTLVASSFTTFLSKTLFLSFSSVLFFLISNPSFQGLRLIFNLQFFLMLN